MYVAIVAKETVVVDVGPGLTTPPCACLVCTSASRTHTIKFLVDLEPELTNTSLEMQSVQF